MSSSRYRVIASNLHVGGGVQVGASILDEAASLANHPNWGCLISVTDFEVSSAVARNAAPESLGKLRCEVFDRRPGSWRSMLRDLRRYDGSAVVFGPIYSLPRSPQRVLGYADVTSVYPPVSGTTTIRSRVGGCLSRTEAALQHDVVVETSAMAARLSGLMGTRAPRLHVVPNAVNGALLTAMDDNSLAEQLETWRKKTDLLLAFPARPYPHKNFQFLPLEAAELRARGICARFAVTLRRNEFLAASDAVRAVCVNVGELTVDRIATLLRRTDGVFFPSLLEAYSATPLEALAVGVPLYASDRDFVRAICGDAAVYFDPLDAKSAADAVIGGSRDVSGQMDRRSLGQAIAAAAPGPRARAESFLSLLYGRSLLSFKEGSA